MSKLFVRIKFLMPQLILLLALGCGLVDPTPAIQSRFDAFVSGLASQDISGCLNFVDPVYVRAQGEGKVKVELGLLLGIFKIGKLSTSDVRVDDITLSKDRKTAQISFSIQSKGEWKSQSPSKWVRIEDQWYIAF